jgi:hypothetical protein
MKQHSKRVVTEAGTQVTVDELEEMAFEERRAIVVDRKAGLYRYTDNGGVHYVAPIAAPVEAPVTRTFEEIETAAQMFQDGPR